MQSPAWRTLILIRYEMARRGGLLAALHTIECSSDAIKALHKAIPLRWRIRNGAWSSDPALRRIDIRNYLLGIPPGGIVSVERVLVDRAIARAGR